MENITTSEAHLAVAGSMICPWYIRSTSSTTSSLGLSTVQYGNCEIVRALGLKLMWCEVALVCPRFPSHLLSKFSESVVDASYVPQQHELSQG